MTTLDADAAKALADFRGYNLRFGGLRALDVDTAAALAEVKGNLGLCGVSEISLDVAKALAGSRGDVSLGFPRGVSLEVANALAGFKGQGLWVNSYKLAAIGAETPLTPQTAQFVCACLKDWPVSFPLTGVTAFEMPDAVEIATILATAKGLLVLPYLERISPKTLTALRKQKDLEIPPLDTLEMIAEPNGSHAEEFTGSDDYRQLSPRSVRHYETQESHPRFEPMCRGHGFGAVKNASTPGALRRGSDHRIFFRGLADGHSNAVCFSLTPANAARRQGKPKTEDAAGGLHR